ncbi:MAG: molybdopterin cofactor-binding domain-containing protein, partial [Pseudomonadota bacterium]
MGETKGIGARLPRREDDRFLRGRGRYVGDVRRPGMLEMAFLRSPFAHARITGVERPEGAAIYTADDLEGVNGIRADSALPGFRRSVQPVLATDKVRHVGEPIAACLAETRAEAEDLAELVSVGFEELPAVHDMTRARDADAPLIHEHWDENAFLDTGTSVGFEAAIEGAAVTVTRHYRTARQCMSPIEGRGCLAEWDGNLQQIVLTTAQQMSHLIRSGLAECLGLEEGQVRVISPDVGGGFGYKGILLAEEVIACHLAMRLERPVRWLEDRREQLAGNANC